MVLRARWSPTLLSLDLRWLDSGEVMTGCALPGDEEFEVERPDADPVIEYMRVSFSDFCAKHRTHLAPEEPRSGHLWPGERMDDDPEQAQE